MSCCMFSVSDIGLDFRDCRAQSWGSLKPPLFGQANVFYVEPRRPLARQRLGSLKRGELDPGCSQQNSCPFQHRTTADNNEIWMNILPLMLVSSFTLPSSPEEGRLAPSNSGTGHEHIARSSTVDTAPVSARDYASTTITARSHAVLGYPRCDVEKSYSRFVP